MVGWTETTNIRWFFLSCRLLLHYCACCLCLSLSLSPLVTDRDVVHTTIGVVDVVGVVVVGVVVFRL